MFGCPPNRKPRPRQWPRQPWFIETDEVHGNCNLIIFTDSSIAAIQSILSK